jgi:CRP-like cAMP-binding protein
MSVAHPESVALQKRFDAFPLATHDTGETVLAAGSKTGRLLILRKGAVAVTREGIEIARVAEPGAVFGEMSALLDQPHSAVVRAVEPSQFNVAHATALQDPVALYCVAAVLARRLDGANEALVELKDQIRVGRPRKVIDETVEKIEGLLTISATKSYLRRVPI